MKTRGPSLIDLANSRLSISKACAQVGMDTPEMAYGSMKMYCPFGSLFHNDGGQSKAFRIYPESNSAYCFACGAYYSPVRLIALHKDVTEAEAAQIILDETGFIPPDFASQWDALMGTTVDVDRDALSEALLVACSRIDPLWEINQFEADIAAVLSQCLALLPKIKNSDDASQWLSVAKQVMQRALGAHSG